jgi:hypothetical protein
MKNFLRLVALPALRVSMFFGKGGPLVCRKPLLRGLPLLLSLTACAAADQAAPRSDMNTPAPSRPALLSQKTDMFGVIELAEGEVAVMDGGINRAAGHTVRVLPDGSGRWERRIDTMGNDQRKGRGELVLEKEELHRLKNWADEIWKFGDPANPWPPRKPGAGPPPQPPPWVWAALVRRGDVVRMVQGDQWTGYPKELAPLIDWLRTRVDAAAGANP